MAKAGKANWNLESFLDSLIYELDKAQDTLSVKGINRKLTYTVKDIALDLHVFPEYRGDKILFSTAGPGDIGASKLSLQLGSISDRQIRETTKQPLDQDDISIDMIEEIGPEVKASLKKVGVNSARDLDRMKKRNVDLGKVVKEKTGKESDIDYGMLAGLINKSRRKTLPPRVSRISEEKGHLDIRRIAVEGDNLFVAQGLPDFPIGLVNQVPVRVVAFSPEKVVLEVPAGQLNKTENQMAIAMDPYAIITLKLHADT